MTTTGAISCDRDVMKVSGDDAATYLQGQISQDVDRLDVGDSAWSLVLQPSGKVDVWLRLHRLDTNEFVIDVDAGHGEMARARLERFKLRTAVEVEALPGWSMVSVKGPDAASHPVEAQLSAVVTWPGFEGVDHIGQRCLAAREANEGLGEASIGAPVVVREDRLGNLLQRIFLGHAINSTTRRRRRS